MAMLSFGLAPAVMAVGLLALVPTAASAQDMRPPGVAPGGTVSLTFENDIFGGDDRNYTNGVRIDYLSPRNDLPVWGRFAREHLGWLTDATEWYATYALGQNIFTPADITLDVPPADDRPYAGYLYGSIGIVADRGDRLDTIALDFGVVGPAAQSDHVQEIVHDLIGADEPRGWESQLRNEPAFRLLYERKERFLYDFGLDFIDVDAAPNFSLALGNVDTSASIGLTLRIGDDLADNYGPPRVRPAVAGPGFFNESQGFGWYLFAGAEGRAIGRNIFIEGNTFRNSTRTNPERLVADFQMGIALQFQGAELTYTHVFRSPEFKDQERFSEFGSVNLKLKF